MQHISHSSMILLLAKKYAYENKKTFGLLLLAIAAFLSLWLGVNLLFTNRALFAEVSQCILYFMGLFLFGCLSGAMLFAEFSSKPKAITFLMMPGTAMAKFVSMLIFGVVLFLAGYTIVFLILDSGAIYLANLKNNTNYSVINPLQIDQYENLIYPGPWSTTFYIYLAVQAYFILVSIWSPKYSVVKALVGLGLLWVAFILLTVTLNSILPDGIFTNGLKHFEMMALSGRRKVIDLPAWLPLSVTIFWKFLIAPLLWTTAFFRLKETQLR